MVQRLTSTLLHADEDANKANFARQAFHIVHVGQLVVLIKLDPDAERKFPIQVAQRRKRILTLCFAVAVDRADSVGQGAVAREKCYAVFGGRVLPLPTKQEAC